jgi:hypothetical protein
MFHQPIRVRVKMINNQSQSSSVFNEQKPSGKVFLRNNQYLIKYVILWHGLLPSLISLSVWLMTYGHSNSMREFLVFFFSHLLVGFLTAARMNFSSNLKDEFLRNEPQVNQPDWFKKEEFNREEI